MYKILLVDDEILVREAIRDNIKWPELGFELVKDCENGKDAIAYVREHPVDVVLTDICMPHVDGMELSKYLSEVYPGTAIIIFSGYDDFEYAKQAIKYQVSEYILKPVTGRELKDTLIKVKEKLDKNQQLRDAYKSQTKSAKTIVANNLINLIKGTQKVETSVAELEGYGVIIKGSAYRVAVLDIDVYSELYEVDAEAKKESALMAFVANNIAKEIVEGRKDGVVFQDSDNRSYILFYTNCVKEEKKCVQKIAKQIQDKVFQTTGLSLSVGIGNFVSSLGELARSCEGAVAVLNYRYLKGDGMIFDCEEEKRQKSDEDLEEILNSLLVAIRKEAKEEAFITLDEYKEWLRQWATDKNAAIAYLHQAQYRIQEEVAAITGEAMAREQQSAPIFQARTLDKAIQYLKDYVESAFLAMGQVVHSPKERQTSLALDYIRAHYHDSNITLQEMCEYLQISTSHFSTIFKEETGKTFLEVLNGVRMEKAKQLLRDTSLKNYEIAEKVGFSDPHYFNIAFKKTVGTTPKQYAREHRQ